MAKNLGDALLEMFETGTTDFTEKVPTIMPPSASPFAAPAGLGSLLGTSAPVPSLLGGPMVAAAKPKKSNGFRRGQFICVIGKPGIGKSSWAVQWPSPEILITDRDQGMIDLCSEGLLPAGITEDDIHMATSYGAYKSNLEIALNNESKSIVCEDLRGMQALCLDHCSKTDHQGDYSNRSFLNYQAGPIQAAETYFQQLIDLMKLAQTRGKHVIVVGHSRAITQDNKTGEDWIADSLEMDKRFSAIVQAQFMNIFHIVDAVPVEKRSGKAKASSDFSRWMYVNANPFFLAKNRMGLVGECEFPSDPRAAYLSYCTFARRDPKTGYKLGT